MLLTSDGGNDKLSIKGVGENEKKRKKEKDRGNL
jgi:hypothetical protein